MGTSPRAAAGLLRVQEPPGVERTTLTSINLHISAEYCLVKGLLSAPFPH